MLPSISVIVPVSKTTPVPVNATSLTLSAVLLFIRSVALQVVADVGVAATVVVAANATTEAYPAVGYAQTTVANGENATIFLNIG